MNAVDSVLLLIDSIRYWVPRRAQPESHERGAPRGSPPPPPPPAVQAHLTQKCNISTLQQNRFASDLLHKCSTSNSLHQCFTLLRMFTTEMLYWYDIDALVFLVENTLDRVGGELPENRLHPRSHLPYSDTIS